MVDTTGAAVNQAPKGKQVSMTRRAHAEQVFSIDCPTREVLDIITNRWVMLIAMALQDDEKRFGALHRQIEGISQKMLTQSLRSMERDGIVNRTVYAGPPIQVGYALTTLGRSLLSPLMLLRSWSEQNITQIRLAQQAFVAAASGGRGGAVRRPVE